MRLDILLVVVILLVGVMWYGFAQKRASEAAAALHDQSTWATTTYRDPDTGQTVFSLKHPVGFYVYENTDDTTESGKSLLITSVPREVSGNWPVQCNYHVYPRGYFPHNPEEFSAARQKLLPDGATVSLVPIQIGHYTAYQSEETYTKTPDYSEFDGLYLLGNIFFGKDYLVEGWCNADGEGLESLDSEIEASMSDFVVE